MVHHDGDPYYCASDCSGPHYEDAAPAVCPRCGGAGRACFPDCTGQARRYEPFEGRTGAGELIEEGS